MQIADAHDLIRIITFLDMSAPAAKNVVAQVKFTFTGSDSTREMMDPKIYSIEIVTPPQAVADGARVLELYDEARKAALNAPPPPETGG